MRKDEGPIAYDNLHESQSTRASIVSDFKLRPDRSPVPPFGRNSCALEWGLPINRPPRKGTSASNLNEPDPYN